MENKILNTYGFVLNNDADVKKLVKRIEDDYKFLDDEDQELITSGELKSVYVDEDTIGECGTDWEDPKDMEIIKNIHLTHKIFCYYDGDAVETLIYIPFDFYKVIDKNLKSFLKGLK